VTPAPEPNDIIWENLEFDRQTLSMNKRKVYILVAFVMMGILSLMTFMEQHVAKLQQMFPLDQLCQPQDEVFGSDDRFLIYAQIDKGPSLEGKGHGIYQCYCADADTFTTLMDSSSFCHEYIYLTEKAVAISKVTSILVTIFNLTLRSIISRLIS
jgi:hypothetical protein